MKFKNLFNILSILLLTFFTPKSSHAIGYPALDTTSNWNIGSFGFDPSSGDYIRQVSKNVWTSPGVSQNKSVFYEISVIGIRKGTTDYYLNCPTDFADVNHSSVQFNTSPLPNSSRSEIDWYKYAPESWVKPGMNGMSYISGPMPQF